MAIDVVGLAQQVAHTADAFRPGHAAFVRVNDNPEALLSLVYCLGYEEGTGTLQLQWSKEAASHTIAPPRGDVVKCHVVMKGVLYSVQGTVRDISEGPMPLIKLKVPITCLAVALRKHQRYSVLGCLRLSDHTGQDDFYMKSFEPMNISYGGFGACLPPIPWQKETSKAFSLKVLAEREGAPIIELPSLELSGATMLCRRSRPTPEGKTFVGCAFQLLTGRGSAVLECWLSTYVNHLREV